MQVSGQERSSTNDAQHSCIGPQRASDRFPSPVIMIMIMCPCGLWDGVGGHQWLACSHVSPPCRLHTCPLLQQDDHRRDCFILQARGFRVNVNVTFTAAQSLTVSCHQHGIKFCLQVDLATRASSCWVSSSTCYARRTCSRLPALRQARRSRCLPWRCEFVTTWQPAVHCSATPSEYSCRGGKAPDRASDSYKIQVRLCVQAPLDTGRGRDVYKMVGVYEHSALQPDLDSTTRACAMSCRTAVAVSQPRLTARATRPWESQQALRRASARGLRSSACSASGVIRCHTCSHA